MVTRKPPAAVRADEEVVAAGADAADEATRRTGRHRPPVVRGGTRLPARPVLVARGPDEGAFGGEEQLLPGPELEARVGPRLAGGDGDRPAALAHVVAARAPVIDLLVVSPGAHLVGSGRTLVFVVASAAGAPVSPAPATARRRQAADILVGIGVTFPRVAQIDPVHFVQPHAHLARAPAATLLVEHDGAAAHRDQRPAEPVAVAHHQGVREERRAG
jgi:hypothetical protein